MIIANPECRAEKHRNCDGVGWNETTDEPAPCPCQCHVRMTRSDAKDVLRGFHYGGGPSTELWEADPQCEHDIYQPPGGGIKCHRCGGWYCY